jgi:hypothetical protein
LAGTRWPSGAGLMPNNSFKPKPLRLGLIQALGSLCNRFGLVPLQRPAPRALAAARPRQHFGNIALARRHPGLSPRTVHAPETARLAAHPAPAATRPSHSARSVFRGKPSAPTVAAGLGFQRAPDRSRLGAGDGASPIGEAPNNSFKPNSFRSTNSMAGRACHAVCSATRVGLIQALDR